MKEEINGKIEEEVHESLSIFLLLTLLLFSIAISYGFKSYKVKWVHESVVSLGMGILTGILVRLTTGSDVVNFVNFKATFFLNLLLPPIILNSGYDLQKTTFFRHLGVILIFAVLGTLISAFVIGAIIWAVALTGVHSIKMNFVECLMYGSLLSSTDPVTVLAIFSQLGVDPNLYSIIFGESIMNDAISIVMFTTLSKFLPSSSHSSATLKELTFGHGVAIFLKNFTASLLLGLATGVICALILKHVQLHKHPALETAVITIMAYNSYFMAMCLELSGIVTLLFCGITMKHYAYDNMTGQTRHTTKNMFHLLAQCSESFIFIYMGISLFTSKEEFFAPIFVLSVLFSLIISRFCNIFPLSWGVNFLSMKWGGKNIIPYNYQCMLFWTGLRGAMSLALASQLDLQDDKSSHIMRGTTLIVVVFTVFFFGGTTKKALERFHIETGIEKEEDLLDCEYSAILQLLDPNVNGLDISDESLNDTDSKLSPSWDSQEDIELQATPVKRKRATSLSSEHWFISFDNQYIKPILQHSKIQGNRLGFGNNLQSKIFRILKAQKNNASNSDDEIAAIRED